MRAAYLPLLALAATLLLAQTTAPSSELERLRKENAELKRQVEDLRTQLEKLRKQYADVIRNGVPATTPTPATRPAATRPATPSQDGPGLYRVTAGKDRKFTTTIRAKSREDAIDKALRTVGKDAMWHDENVEIGTLKVEKIGN